jgi:hypothetical protein
MPGGSRVSMESGGRGGWKGMGLTGVDASYDGGDGRPHVA